VIYLSHRLPRSGASPPNAACAARGTCCSTGLHRRHCTAATTQELIRDFEDFVSRCRHARRVRGFGRARQVTLSSIGGPRYSVPCRRPGHGGLRLREAPCFSAPCHRSQLQRADDLQKKMRPQMALDHWQDLRIIAICRSSLFRMSSASCFIPSSWVINRCLHMF
jgi:hypothetical protein